MFIVSDGKPDRPVVCGVAPVGFDRALPLQDAVSGDGSITRPALLSRREFLFAAGAVAVGLVVPVPVPAAATRFVIPQTMMVWPNMLYPYNENMK